MGHFQAGLGIRQSQIGGLDLQFHRQSGLAVPEQHFFEKCPGLVFIGPGVKSLEKFPVKKNPGRPVFPVEIIAHVFIIVVEFTEGIDARYVAGLGFVHGHTALTNLFVKPLYFRSMAQGIGQSPIELIRHAQPGRGGLGQRQRLANVDSQQVGQSGAGQRQLVAAANFFFLGFGTANPEG